MPSKPSFSAGISRSFAFATLLSVALITPAFAANHFIRAGAAGTGDGSSWTNAFPSFASALAAGLIRGDTYFVAGGDYSTENPYINVARNGTAWIYITKANATDNGGESDYSATYASTVATIASLDLDKGYVSIDGVTGSGTTGHGFHILNPATAANSDTILLENGQGPFSIKHCNIEGSGFAATTNPTTGIYYVNTASQKNLYVGNCWVHQVTTNGVIFLNLIGTSYSDYGFLFENNVISETGGCLDPTNHGQGMQLGLGSEMGFCLIRDDIFSNIVGSGMVVFLGTTGANHHDIEIYDNIFYITDLTTYNIISPAVIWAEAQRNGATGVAMTNLSIINNTFYGLGTAVADNVNGSVIIEAPATNNILVNNLWENCRLTGPNEGFATISNSGYFGDNLNVPSGTPKQVSGAASTFVNAPALNFQLAPGGYAVGRGTNFPAMFSTDFAGTVRGGVWDLGAYQLQTTGNAAPTNAQVTITVSP